MVAIRTEEHCKIVLDMLKEAYFEYDSAIEQEDEGYICIITYSLIITQSCHWL